LVHFNFAAFNFAVELKIHFSWRFNFAELRNLHGIIRVFILPFKTGAVFN